MHNPYSEATAVEEGMRAEGEYRQSQKSWERMCLDGMERETMRLANDLAKARRVASTIPQLEAMLELQKAKTHKFAQEYGL